MKHKVLRTLVLATALISCAQAQLLLTVDATAPVKVPETGYLKLGTSIATGNHSLTANSQYLLRDGKPWLPVMGEFHYTRSPVGTWEAELQKMKSAGIDVVASYVIWNHHEEVENQFDWRGNRDLRLFLQLAEKTGLKAMVRIGPWSHAEVRYGGVPDWVVNTMPTRSNDAQYLLFVERFYNQIGRQLKGKLWKDGGPVIGIQIENEFNLSGLGQGEAHIQTLKGLARKAGMDVPFYTVTGWDGTIYPSGEVTPVFGGYPDEPWGVSITELPPKETYAFRFDSRVSGDLGAQTAATAPGTAETDIAQTPFLGAEYGAGLPAMYRRRTLLSGDDIASMLPVQLGSGVNLLGYYMFHGGRNPMGRTSLEESTLTGGYNDTPMINYDFQAPLGPDGQQREVLTKLRPFHYFLQAFGDRLAPMTVRKPAQVPSAPTELQTPRFSVRAAGASAFLFVNNHVRQYPMPNFSDVRFSVGLPSQTVSFPQQGLILNDGDYFVWPINFDLDGTRMVYATVQPITRIDAGAEGIVYVFSATATQPVELAFAESDAVVISTPGARRRLIDGRLVVSGMQVGTTPVATINRPGQKPVHLLVLTQAQSRALVLGQFGGRARLLLCNAQAWLTPAGLELRSAAEPRMAFAMFPALARKPSASLAIQADGKDGLFHTYSARASVRKFSASVRQTRPAQAVPPVMRGGVAGAAIQPTPETFRAAASWEIDLNPAQFKGFGKDLDDVLMEPAMTGDIGRLFSGTRMLDDWYYFGYPWQVGLKQFASALRGPLSLSVLPLRADAPIYLPREHRPDFAGQTQIATLAGVKLTPVYRLTVKP